MPSHKSFGSRKAKPRGQPSDEDERFSHAPAFAAFRSNSGTGTTPQRGASEQFQYMMNTSTPQEASWSTIDPQTGKRKWNENATNDTSPPVDSTTPWGWSATSSDTYMTKDGTLIAPEVTAQFIPVSEIMNENHQSKTSLERHNTDLLGNSGSSQIVSMIGGQELTLNRIVENRFAHMDRDGNYVDGKNRGRPKKRHMDEFHRRVSEREDELKKANTIWDEWNSLSPEEQGKRKAQAELNRQTMQATLDIDAMGISEMPKIYRAGIRQIAAKTRKYNSRQARAYTGHSSMPSAYTRSLHDLGEESRSYQSTKSSTATSSVGDIETNSDFVPIEDYDEDLIFFNSDDSPSTRAPRRSREIDWIDRSLENNTLLDSPINERSDTRPGSRSSDRIAFSWGSASVAHSSPMNDSWPPNPPGLETYAGLLPMQEVPEPLISTLPWTDEMEELRLTCERLPRVVTLALTDKNMAYTGKAIVERLFSGTIQEMQFFPEDRQAIIIFLRPHEAKTFLTHVASAVAYSAHEARRLQFQATWYKNQSEGAIMPASKSVLQYTLTHSASRTLLLRGLPNSITTRTLLSALQARFSSEHVVKGALISPSKAYERARSACLAAIVEFAAIAHAAVAREAFDFNEVPELSHTSAEFVPDASTVVPASKRWCRCDVCSGAAARVQSAEAATNARRRANVNKNKHGLGDGDEDDEEENEYDVEADLLAPDSYAYGHEDKKRPRLTSYDEAGMRRHARERDRARE